MDYMNKTQNELIAELKAVEKKYKDLKSTCENGLIIRDTEKNLLEKLIQSSKDLIQFQEKIPDYHGITQLMLEISGAKYGVLNIFDDNGLDFTTVSVNGMKENLEKGLAILGIELQNKHWNHDPVRAEKTRHQTISRFNHLHELSGEVISKGLVQVLQKTIGIDEVFVVKVAKEKKIWGDFTLIFSKGETLQHANFVELYANQVGMFLDRYKMADSVAAGEIMIHAITDAAHDAILMMDPKGLISYWNPAAERIFGHTNSEAIGKSLHQLIVPEQYHKTYRSAYPVFKQSGKGAAIGNTLDLIGLRKDGNEIAVQLSLSSIKIHNAWHSIGIIRDITDQKLAEKTLSESEKRFHSLFDNMSEGVALHELEFLDGKPVDYRIMDTNARFGEILGIPREQVVGKLSTVAYGSEVPPYFNQYVDVAINKKPISFETYFALMDKYFAISAIPWQENGFATIFTDITERKKAEEVIKLKNESLTSLVAEKDKFFSIIAHDLRSPFSSFLGLTQIMAEELPNLTLGEVQKIAMSMKDSATNLYDLLENLLQWAQIQKRDISFHPEPVSVDSAIGEIVRIMEKPAKMKGIEILLNVPENLIVEADRNMLQSVLRNLVSNAVKFTKKDGKINVSARVASLQQVEITVQDTGIGMSQDLVGNLFRLDVKTNRKGTEGEASTGLGLILCKEFVEKHGGKIRVESEEGQGSTFSFAIPYQPKPKEEI